MIPLGFLSSTVSLCCIGVFLFALFYFGSIQKEQHRRLPLLHSSSPRPAVRNWSPRAKMTWTKRTKLEREIKPFNKSKTFQIRVISAERRGFLPAVCVSDFFGACRYCKVLYKRVSKQSIAFLSESVRLLCYLFDSVLKRGTSSSSLFAFVPKLSRPFCVT